MNYTITRLIAGKSLDNVESRTRNGLANHGFGVLTEIDVEATMKTELNVEMAGYRILGASNPEMAYKALGIEPRVCAMLPCNVILREIDGIVAVSAIDPVASMQAIKNAELTTVAGQVRDLLEKAVRSI